MAQGSGGAIEEEELEELEEELEELEEELEELEEEEELLDVMLEETLDEAPALDDEKGLVLVVSQSVVVMVDVGTSLAAAHEHSKANAKTSESGDCFILDALRRSHRE